MTGATGVTGVTGATGPDSIIPFASGSPVALTTVVGGLLNSSSAVGFGNSLTGITPVGGVVDLLGLTSVAFSMPRDGIVTSISGYLSTSDTLSLVGTTITISVQLYQSTTPDDTFTVIPGALTTLTPPLTGVLGVGSTSSGTVTGLDIPVAAGSRLLLVFSANVTGGIDTAAIIDGYTSAGIGIS